MLQLTNLKQDSYQFIPQPPKDNVSKYYLEFLLDMNNDQNLNYISRHSGQDVFCKLSQIIWKETKYESMAIIMGGFHILLITKYVNLMSLKK